MNGFMKGRPVEILLAEDNPGDARLAKEALTEGKILNNLHIVNDGIEAKEFLRREGIYSNVPKPDIILLDLNMPRMDGREFLSWIKNEEEFKRIPVIVLTVSKDEADIFSAYDMHANCFITKPVEYESLLEVVKSIEDFWLTIVKLPDHTSAKNTDET
jgi:two-component system, chemotaxis family, response regulator Rcp1